MAAVKYEAPKDPLETEAQIKFMLPSSVEKKRFVQQFIQTKLDALATDFKEIDTRTFETQDDKMRVMADLVAEFTAWKFWQTTAQKNEIEGQLDHAVFIQFVGWLMGVGRDEDHKRTPWGRKPMIEIPSVREFLETHCTARMKFMEKLHMLAFRGPTDIDSCWLYYKYIVRNPQKGDNDEFLKDFDMLMKWDSGENAILELQDKAQRRNKKFIVAAAQGANPDIEEFTDRMFNKPRGGHPAEVYGDIDAQGVFATAPPKPAPPSSTNFTKAELDYIGKVIGEVRPEFEKSQAQYNDTLQFLQAEADSPEKTERLAELQKSYEIDMDNFMNRVRSEFDEHDEVSEGAKQAIWNQIFQKHEAVPPQAAAAAEPEVEAEASSPKPMSVQTRTLHAIEQMTRQLEEMPMLIAQAIQFNQAPKSTLQMPGTGSEEHTGIASGGESQTSTPPKKPEGSAASSEKPKPVSETPPRGSEAATGAAQISPPGQGKSPAQKSIDLANQIIQEMGEELNETVVKTTPEKTGGGGAAAASPTKLAPSKPVGLGTPTAAEARRGYNQLEAEAMLNAVAVDMPSEVPDEEVPMKDGKPDVDKFENETAAKIRDIMKSPGVKGTALELQLGDAATKAEKIHKRRKRRGTMESTAEEGILSLNLH